MKTYNDIGIGIPQVQLPRPDMELTKWAVIACDQFTSEPEYWHEVEKLVGNAPSTYNLVFPEVYLEQPGKEERIAKIQSSMRSYLDKGVIQPHEGMVFVERQAFGKTRRGLLLCLDLEQYDFNKGSSSLIRATEGTIVERLPPRMKIRSGAVLELPHILVLIDDPQRTVIEPLAGAGLQKLYDFELMLGSGHLKGYAVSAELEAQVVAALRALSIPEAFAARYAIGQDKPVLLFAMGDGNHSLATAKAVWKQMKPKVGMDHPARYAMVEVENVHDTGLEFAPIHRVLFGLKQSIFAKFDSTFGKDFSHRPVASAEEMIKQVNSARGPKQAIGTAVAGKGYGVIEIANPPTNLPVGTLQLVLDMYMKEGGAEKIDYVHGEEVVCRLGMQPGNAGFYVAGMDKSDLFKTVILDGALPRKTFSMGEAREKRFYMEARKIV